ncbi:MAG: EAL and HDOD domain-containing protein [Lachnospiraceae bacterium]
MSMLVTLIPLFNDKLEIDSYSLFTQKKNLLLNPILLGAGKFDDAFNVEGIEIIEKMGIETLAPNHKIFVSVTNVSIFSTFDSTSTIPSDRIVLLMDSALIPDEKTIARLKELKSKGYGLAIRKLGVAQFEEYKEVLVLLDYILLNHKKIVISKAKIFFHSLYPNIKLCAVNIDDHEVFEQLKKEGGYSLYEGEFYRVPENTNENEIAPIKLNYLQLLESINSDEFELDKAADIIGRDTSLTLSLLKMVNNIAINSEITSIRHAAAMLGEKELKKWISTAVVNSMYSEEPNELTRLTLIRAKFAENLAKSFDLAISESELFLMGLFSLLDVILKKPMSEALELVTLSKNVKEALLNKSGTYGELYKFVLAYENANWQEVSRQMIMYNIDMPILHEAYINSIVWYRKVALGE